MTYQIPTTEPSTFTAGDRFHWTKSLTNFPAPTWTLTYTLISTDWQFVATATDNGDGKHLVSEDPATTADWPVGRVRWQATVTDGTDRFLVGRGEIDIRADFATATTGYDARTDARRWLDWLLAQRTAMAAGTLSVSVASYAIEGHSRTFRTLAELDVAISIARRDVVLEDRAERIRQGLGHSGKIRVRF